MFSPHTLLLPYVTIILIYHYYFRKETTLNPVANFLFYIDLKFHR
jgi:hypothetical protein